MQCVSLWGVQSLTVRCVSSPSARRTGSALLYTYLRLSTISARQAAA